MPAHALQFDLETQPAAAARPASPPRSNAVPVPDVAALHDSAILEHEEARERALILAWRAGDREALGELLALHEQRVFGVCLSMCGDPELARDLAQDTLVKIITGLPGFAFRSRLSTWVTRVAMNVCLTDRRKRRLRRTVSLDAAGYSSISGSESAENRPARGGARSVENDPPVASGRGRPRAGQWGERGDGASSGELGVVEAVESREARELLAAALSRIEPQQRAILILRDGQDLNYAEIASVLEIPEGTVKSRIFRARATLRKELETAEGPHPPIRDSAKSSYPSARLPKRE